MDKVTVKEVMESSLPGEVRKLVIRGLAAKSDGYVLAIDFDGTLCKQAWPGIGPAFTETIRAAKEAQALGIKLVLWTCREGEKQQEAVDWCREKGMVFDAVNSNLPERIRAYGTDPRKIGYDELWDDKAGTPARFWGMGI